jgi:hypothetical protein
VLASLHTLYMCLVCLDKCACTKVAFRSCPPPSCIPFVFALFSFNIPSSRNLLLELSSSEFSLTTSVASFPLIYTNTGCTPLPSASSKRDLLPLRGFPQRTNTRYRDEWAVRQLCIQRRIMIVLILRRFFLGGIKLSFVY